MRIPHRLIAALTLCVALVLSAQAEDLKGFYIGSGGISSQDHRVVMIDFAADGTALIQQKWHNKHLRTWHARWKKDRDTVTLTYELARDAPKHATLPVPLVFTFKHGTLTPTSWDFRTLGVLGPPNLAPFGGKDIKHPSVESCQSLNTFDPTGDCITWKSDRLVIPDSSNQKKVPR
ncbi:MAG: hypothetical protein WDN23_18990 [Edaphobacter sp.]